MFWGFWSGIQAEEIFEKIWAEQLCCLTMSAGTSPTADLLQHTHSALLCTVLLMQESGVLHDHQRLIPHGHTEIFGHTADTIQEWTSLRPSGQTGVALSVVSLCQHRIKEGRT